MNWIKDFIPTLKQNLSRLLEKIAIVKFLKVYGNHAKMWIYSLYPRIKKNSYVCSKCSNHFKINVSERIEITFDENSYRSLNEEEEFKDYLNFIDTKKYKDRFQDALKKTGTDEALSIGTGKIKEREIVVAIFEFDFLGGSMGAVVGKRFVKAVEYSIENNIPLISFSTSGGARMQESMISLFQMGKTASAAIKV